MRRRMLLGATPLLAGIGRAQAADAAPDLQTLAPTIAARFADVQSVVLWREDRLLFEYHREGGEAALRDVQSVTKSVLSLAVGAALGQGLLRSIDQPLSELLPAGVWRADDAEGTRLSLRHLLTMTAGFAPGVRLGAAAADDAGALLSRARAAAPGTRFAYDNLSANLLSIALQGATGRSSADYARRQLFEPLGIEDFAWATGAQGHTLGFSGLKLRTRDMATLGRLMLKNGAWRGTALLPAAYATAAVTVQNPGGPPVGLPYGYLWWVVPSEGDTQTFFASGYGGQLLWVHRPLQLVIAVTSEVSAASQQRGQALALLRNELFRAAQAAPAR